MNDHGNFFCFGLGFSGRVIARHLKEKGWKVGGTCREAEAAQELSNEGIDARIFDGRTPLADFPEVMAGVTHLLVSIPPSAETDDPVLQCHRQQLAGMTSLHWIGYLSTTGVYGDTGGQLVNETAPLKPTSDRSRRRVRAEEGWRALWQENGLPGHIFRLSGIYGPGRSAFNTVRNGKARQIIKPDHRFSRIHVEDIADVIEKSIVWPNPGAVYNLCDDEAAPPADVTAYACALLGIDPPPSVSFEEAKDSMSAMALSFWNDNRLIDNARIKHELVVNLRYPTYREGLRAIYALENQ